MEVKVLPRQFYLRDSVTIAQELIGKLLVRDSGSESLVCRIVETEAYNQEDPASHSFHGLTARTAPMFEAGGIAYVYFIYGMYDCFNVVTDRAGYGSAVLIRAAEPISGIEAMWRCRFPEKPFPEPITAQQLCAITGGPGKLARAMGIERARDNGKDLSESDLTIRDDAFESGSRIEHDVRIGISVGTEVEWRFYLSNSPCVSRFKDSRATAGEQLGAQPPRSSIRRSRSSAE